MVARSVVFALCVGLGSLRADAGQNPGEHLLWICEAEASQERVELIPTGMPSLESASGEMIAISAAGHGKVDTFGRGPGAHAAACVAATRAEIVATDVVAAVDRSMCQDAPRVLFEDQLIVRASGTAPSGSGLILIGQTGTMLGRVVAVTGEFLLVNRSGTTSGRVHRAKGQTRVRRQARRNGTAAIGNDLLGNQVQFAVGGIPMADLGSSSSPNVVRSIDVAGPFRLAVVDKCW